MFELKKVLQTGQESCRFDPTKFDTAEQRHWTLFPVTWRTFLGMGEGSICDKCARVSRIICSRRRWADGVRKDRRLKHPSTGMASCWLPLRQEYPIITKKAHEALHTFSLASLLWTQWRLRTGRGFRHWRRTWGYACQTSELIHV
jgi:hypothetical protein